MMRVYTDFVYKEGEVFYTPGPFSVFLRVGDVRERQPEAKYIPPWRKTFASLAELRLVAPHVDEEAETGKLVVLRQRVVGWERVREIDLDWQEFLATDFEQKVQKNEPVILGTISGRLNSAIQEINDPTHPNNWIKNRTIWKWMP